MWFVLFLQELNNTCFNASVDCAKYNKTDDFQDIWADCEGKNAMITFLVLYALTIGGVLIMGFRQALYNYLLCILNREFVGLLRIEIIFFVIFTSFSVSNLKKE